MRCVDRLNLQPTAVTDRAWAGGVAPGPHCRNASRLRSFLDLTHCSQCTANPWWTAAASRWHALRARTRERQRPWKETVLASGDVSSNVTAAWEAPAKFQSRQMSRAAMSQGTRAIGRSHYEKPRKPRRPRSDSIVKERGCPQSTPDLPSQFPKQQAPIATAHQCEIVARRLSPR